MRYPKNVKQKNTASAMDFALRKLSYGMKSENELIGLLKAAGYTGEETEETVKELKSLGYVDDVRYIEEFYNLGKSKKRSNNRIIRELCLKGIDSGVARSVIEELFSENDEEEDAFSVAGKMFDMHIAAGQAFDKKIKAKIGRKLISLGYNEGICYRVLNRLRSACENKE